MSNSFIMTESIVRPAKMPYGRLKDNGFVGIEGEHAARALVVETKDDLSAFASINLIIDDLDCGAMTKTTSGGTTTLSMTLTSSMIGRSGRKICQLIMVNSGNTVVQKSSQFEAYVGRANEIERSVDDGVTIIILSEAVTEMAREAAAAAAEEAVADVVEDCQAIADAASASADAAAQSASDAQTAAASITVDATLDPTSTHAIQNKAVASEISSIKADLDGLDERVEALESGGSGSGLTDAVKTAMMNLVNHLAWDDDDPTGQTYITALQNALYPPAYLVSITAVYTQSGTVYNTDTLNDLKSDLVVTAHYSDSTSHAVTDYTLSGTLAAGTSVIAVNYNGKSTTFNVTVTAIPYSFHEGIYTGDSSYTGFEVEVSGGHFHVTSTAGGKSRSLFVDEDSFGRTIQSGTMFSLSAGDEYEFKIKNIVFASNSSASNAFTCTFRNPSDTNVCSITTPYSQTTGGTLPDASSTGTIETSTDVTCLKLVTPYSCEYEFDFEFWVNGERWI